MQSSWQSALHTVGVQAANSSGQHPHHQWLPGTAKYSASGITCELAALSLEPLQRHQGFSVVSVVPMLMSLAVSFIHAPLFLIKGPSLQNWSPTSLQA